MMNIGKTALALPRRVKQLILALVDLVLLLVALWAAFAIRFETVDIPFTRLYPVGFIAPLIAVPLFTSFGLYRAIVHYLGLHALLAIVKAVGIYTVALIAAIYLIPLAEVPRSVALIHGMLALLLIGASRVLARYWLSNARIIPLSGDHRKRVAVYGAGSAGVQLATALAHSRELAPVAFVDDDQSLYRKRIGGLEVHAPGELGQLVQRLGISEVLLALPSVSRARRREIIASLETLPVQVRTLPGVAELAEGKIRTGDLREVEIEDLLGRDPIDPNPDLLKANIADKVVMVTGAGGSIGSELCRQILTQGPRDLVLYESNEFALYDIEQDLAAQLKGLSRGVTHIWPALGSVCNAKRLESVVRRFNVQTIYHAAAYKHVPMVEMNPCEGALNNVYGTWCAAQAALATGVETFVLISTDKAVRPTNTMGATKRFAEMILQALAVKFPEKTRFTMVRFGNVLDSSGSVVPLFREQIKRGGPITVTDPRIVRYFMTIPEAAQLVIQAGAMGKDGDVFVLDMGDPVKILDLAQRMVQLSGLSLLDSEHPDGDIEIVFTGLRPGEKLYEELLIGENVSTTSHSRIRHANEKMLALVELERLLSRLRIACDAGDGDQVRAVLLEAVEEFVPQCGNQDLLNIAKSR